RELAMHLALGRPRADRAPRDEVRGELRGDRIEELAARRGPGVRQVEQPPTRPPEALVDHEASVEMRIVDETLPAHRGARLLEIDAHHDTEIARVLVGQDAQAPPVVERGGRVV